LAAVVPESLSPILPDPRNVVWAGGDESGQLDFAPSKGRYFLVATVAGAASLVTDLEELSRKLARRSLRTGRPKPFHANEDDSRVKTQVFEILQAHEIRVDATIFDKTTASEELRRDRAAFYTLMWSSHLWSTLPHLLRTENIVRLVVAHMGQYGRAEAFSRTVALATGQAYAPMLYRATLTERPSPPVENVYDIPALSFGWAEAQDSVLLQAADYCAWAVHRQLEHGDARWARMIQKSIATEQFLELPADFKPMRVWSQLPKRLKGTPITLAVSDPAVDVVKFDEVIARAEKESALEETTQTLNDQLNELIKVIDFTRQDQGLALAATTAAIRLCEELLSRDSDGQRTWVALAFCMYQRAFTFGKDQQRPLEAIEAYEALERRCKENREGGVAQLVARGIVNQSILYGRLGRYDECLAGYQRVVDHYGDRTEPLIQEPVTKALLYLAEYRMDHGDVQTAVRQVNRVLERVPLAEYDHQLREVRARADFQLGEVFLLMSRSEEAMTAYNRAIAEFGASMDPHLLDWVQKAFVAKGEFLELRGEYDLAAQIYAQGSSRLQQGYGADGLLLGLTLSACNAAALAIGNLPGWIETTQAVLEGLGRLNDGRAVPWRLLVLQARAYALVRAGHLEDAREEFVEVSKIHATWLDPHQTQPHAIYARSALWEIDNRKDQVSVERPPRLRLPRNTLGAL
jgi:tetratricopeptide (TPR) repeat protein